VPEVWYEELAGRKGEGHPGENMKIKISASLGLSGDAHDSIEVAAINVLTTVKHRLYEEIAKIDSQLEELQ
jgi:hypothetical protein